MILMFYYHFPKAKSFKLLFVMKQTKCTDALKLGNFSPGSVSF